jgi:hypothetical protein
MTGEFSLTSPVPVGGRASHDHFPTPRFCTLALLRFGGLVPSAEPMVLDPACGEGAILSVVKDELPDSSTRGIELDEGRARAACERRLDVIQGDGLALDWDEPDLVIGNPPYTLATDFAWKAAEWAVAAPGRTAALLLRLSFLEPASGRAPLFKHHRPDVLILPRRPMFDGKGHDNITSAWFVWPGIGRLVWLPS